MPNRLRLVDNPTDRALILRELENELQNVQAITIADEPEFDALLSGPEPDCVITDHSLGWSNGLRITNNCKARWPFCPIIMFTGTGSEEIAVRGMKEGLDDYIIKAPQQYYKLRAAVKRSLHLAQAKRQAVALQSEREVLLARETELRKKAEDANRAKDEFLATISHELRTPLTPMLGWVRMLRSRNLTDPVAVRGLEVIERNVLAQTHLIEDLLDVSRIVTGKLELHIQPLNLIELTQSAIASIKPNADARNISLVVEENTPTECVLGDRERLQQVLWNLLSNAIKFTPPGGTVAVRLSQEESKATVQVSDNGEGIEPAFVPYLFDRFTQADASTTRRHGGLGLGLAIVRHLVELHGGSVQAHSDGRGKGARFTVCLPASADQTMPPRSEERQDQPGPDPSLLRNKKLLIVDDDGDTRELLRYALTQWGADVVTASTAQEAVDKLKSNRVQLVLSDIGMEDHDGYWLLHKIKQEHPTLPVIALTAYARPEDEDQARRSGFDAFITKPLEPASIASIVAKNLGTRT
ncbi:MAG TPA: response regulator [Planctomycetota bacterium]|nr:response regulator [Planctomycetota bacterium]